MKRIFTLVFAVAFSSLSYAQVTILSQNWSNTGLITTANDWSSVPNIVGYLGQLNRTVGEDPQTVLADSIAANMQSLNLAVNQTAAQLSANSGGIYEFELTDPVVAMQGSGTADAPFLLITVSTSNLKDIRVRYKLRDIDNNIDNTAQQFALQYRIGNSGSFTNVPSAYVADASTGPSLATLETLVDVTLPLATNNQASLQLRIITCNAPGSDELIGIDDILIQGTSTLPVELVSFTAKPTNSKTNLYWQTASEKNNSHFGIERSKDGDVFSKIGEVKGNGNSTVTQNYQFTDATPSKGISYYRLRQVDFDGTESVSKTVSVNFDGKGQNKFKVYPTLVKDAINVELSDDSKSEIAVRDLTGRVILTQNTEGVSNQTLNLGALSSGLYILSVRSNETLETVKIYKQ